MTSVEEDKQDKSDFEFQVAAHPDLLRGIEFLWDIVYTNTKDIVVEKSA